MTKMISYLRLTIFTLLITFFFNVKSQDNIDSLKKLLRSEVSDSTRISLLNKIGWAYCKVNLDSAVVYANRTLKEYTGNDPKILALTYNLLGNIEYYKSDFNKALEYFIKSNNICKKFDSKNETMRVTNNIGIIYQMKGEYQQSLEYYQKSLKMKEELGLKKGIVVSLINISSLYYELEKYDDAILNSEKALKLAEENYPEKQSIILNNLGASCSASGKFNEALKYLRLAFSLTTTKTNLSEEGMTLQNIGNMYDLQNNNDSALYYYKKALQIKLKLNDKRSLAKSYFGIGAILLNMNKYYESITYLTKAKDIFEEINKQSELIGIYNSLANAYNKTNNNVNAYKILQKAYVLRDSLFNLENSKSINELQTKYETQKKEQQITLLEKENELKQTEIKQKAQQRNWLTGFFIIILIIAVIIYFYYNKTKAAKNKIETLQREIHHRVKNNLAINRRMVEVAEEKTNDEESKRILRQLETRIASMAEIHEQLYRKKDITSVDFRKSLDDINKNIAYSFKMDIPEIKQNFSENIEIGFNKAIPLGLIVNELITNTYKYAVHKDKPLKVTIDVAKEYGKLKIKITDNGKGFPKDFDINKIQSYGLKLVSGLTRQLDGTIRFFNSGGANVEIVVPL